MSELFNKPKPLQSEPPVFRGQPKRAPLLPEQPAPTLKQTVQAAVEQENPVYNFFQGLNRIAETPDADPDFDVITEAQKSPLFTDYPGQLLAARSADELFAIESRIRRELQNRQVLEEAGGLGVATTLASAVATPTIFIPLVGGGATLGSVATRAAGLAFLAASLDEVPLILNQYTRTNLESVFNITAGTVLGAALGTVGTTLSKRKLAKLEREFTQEEPVAPDVTMTREPDGSYRVDEDFEAAEFAPSGARRAEEPTPPPPAREGEAPTQTRPSRTQPRLSPKEQVIKFLDGVYAVRGADILRQVAIHAPQTRVGGFTRSLPRIVQAVLKEITSDSVVARPALLPLSSPVDTILYNRKPPLVDDVLEFLPEGERFAALRAEVEAARAVGLDVEKTVNDIIQNGLFYAKVTRPEKLPLDKLEFSKYWLKWAQRDADLDEAFVRAGGTESTTPPGQPTATGAAARGEQTPQYLTRYNPETGEFEKEFLADPTSLEAVDVGNLARLPLAARKALFINPVARGIMQEGMPIVARAVRRIFQQYSTGGLRMEGAQRGLAPTAEGTIESRMALYQGLLYRALEEQRKAYYTYLTGKETHILPERLFFDANAFFNRSPKPGKMTFSEFKQQVTKALNKTFHGDGEDLSEELLEAAQEAAEEFDPHVMQTVSNWRTNFFDLIVREARSAASLQGSEKFFKELKFDQMRSDQLRGYMYHIFSPTAVASKRNEFIEDMAAHIQDVMSARFSRRIESLLQNEADSREALALLDTGQDELRELVEDLQAVVKSLDDAVLDDPAYALAKEKRREANQVWRKEYDRLLADEQHLYSNMTEAKLGSRRKALAATREDREALLDEAREAEAAISKEVRDLVKQRRSAKRKIKFARRSEGGFAQLREDLIDRIERNEDLTRNRLTQFGQRYATFLKNMDRYSDEKVAAEIKKLEDDFDKTIADIERSEARIAEYRDRLEEARALRPGWGPKGLSKIAGYDLDAADVIRYDNPGGEWIKAKMAQAEEAMKTAPADSTAHRGFSGAVTAHTTTPISLPVERLRKLKGASGEVVRKSSDKYKELKASVDANGWRDETPILIGINHKGEAFLLEGNHRVFVADETGVTNIRAEVRWFNGGETALDAEQQRIARDLEILNSTERRVTARQLRQEKLLVRADTLAGRPELRSLLEARIEDFREKTRIANDARAVRNEKLNAKLEKATPEAVGRLRSEIEQRTAQAREDLANTLEEAGADIVDFANFKVDFSDIAKDFAERLSFSITSGKPLAQLDLLPQVRGPMKHRLLNMPYDIKSKYLEEDSERVLGSYTLAMSSQIELFRAFGDRAGTNAVKAVEEDMNNVTRLLETRTVDEKGVTITPERRRKELEAVARKRVDYVNSVKAFNERLSGMRGLPSDPTSMVYRLGRTFLHLNTATMMGSAAITSISDLARPVITHGFASVFADAYAPLVRGLADLDQREFNSRVVRQLQLFGVGIETVLHSRARGTFDIESILPHQTKFGQLLEQAALKTPLVALFGPWTDLMQQISGMATMARILTDVQDLVAGKLPRAEVEYLASTGINLDMARRIWTQLSEVPEGGTKFRGQWLPNTEKWVDHEAARVFAAAIAEENRKGLSVPGLEQPLFRDEHVFGKMITQFQAFTLGAHSTMLMASLQKRGVEAFHTLSGLTLSMALGTLSYYIWAMTAGERAREEMRKADWRAWMDQALYRSGIIGAFDYPRRIAQEIPYLQPYSSFSGEALPGRRASSLISAIGGPSFTTLGNLANIVQTIADPTASTVRSARKTLVWQNVFYVRSLLDSVEEGLVDTLNLPERRR